MGRELADQLKVPYIETSAKNPPINVENAFHELVRIVRSFQAEDEPIMVKILVVVLKLSGLLAPRY